jgi:hypothetical protein
MLSLYAKTIIMVLLEQESDSITQYKVYISMLSQDDKNFYKTMVKDSKRDSEAALAIAIEEYDRDLNIKGDTV